MTKLLRFALFLSVLCFPVPACLLAETVSLTILHTNDTHSHLLPFHYPSVVPPKSEFAPLQVRTNIGGIARRATLFKQLQAQLGPQGTAVWLVDSGDFSDGTAFSIEYRGAADAAAMNAAGYMFGALGNHEFNNSLPQLKNLLRQFRYPVLCANAIERSTGAPLTQAYEIRKLGTLRIGVFGLLTRSTAGYPATRDGITIANEIETARRMVKILRREADIVIALSHCGDTMDKRIAEAVSGIDVIVGGHSHSRLPFGEIVWNSQRGKKRDSHGTILVQAHQWGGELGRLDLVFEKNALGLWQVARHKASLIAVTHKIPEDTTVAAVVDRYWKPIAPRYNEVIGYASADFIEHGDDLPPYNLMADAIRETFGTEIALENIGGVRAPLIQGKITRGDLAVMDPFDNIVVTFHISGARLRKILQFQRPAVSGIQYRMENGNLTAATVAWKPLLDTHTYTGATNSYFARNGLKGIRVKDTGRQRRDVLTEYVRKTGTVHPVYDSRRVVGSWQ